MRAAPSRRCACFTSLDFDRVLDGLGIRVEVGHVANLCAALGQRLIDGDGRKVGVDRDAPPRHAFERRVEIIVAKGPHPGSQMPEDGVAQLAFIDEQVDAAVPPADAEGISERREFHVACADVQKPGDGVERDQYRGVEIAGLQNVSDRATFVVRTRPGLFDRLDEYRRERTVRLLVP